MKSLIVACAVAATSLTSTAFADNAAQADGKALKDQAKDDKANAKDAGKVGDKSGAKALKKQSAEEKKAGKQEEKAGNKAAK